MHALHNKRILLGVTGGIAAYKSPDLVRRLRDSGAEVRVVMSRAAQEFVRPLTFQATSGNPVHTELLDDDAEAGMGHIELARWADAVLVAPASANRIAALAQGFADDLLTTLCLATRAPLFIAPAMNQAMWDNPAVQANVDILRDRGATLLGPGSGDQACGETGAGRMLEPLELRDALIAALAPNTDSQLTGKTVLLTAGPTREALDPVRYLSNHSSGKMGYAIAEAARNAGARVILVSGPVQLSEPTGVECLHVNSATEMHAAVLSRVADCDVFIGVAAVADYRPRVNADRKIKKSDATLTLELEPNPDILADVAGLDARPFTVGFAAETHDVETYARGKLNRKQLDLIAANQVGENQAFGTDDNRLLILGADGRRVELPEAPKARLAEMLVAEIARSLAGAG